MLHTFTLFDESFAFDSESGALCKMDDIALKVLELWQKHAGNEPSEEELGALAASAGHPDEIKAAAEEIAELKRDKIFFCPRPQVRPEQIYPDKPRIKAMCLHICHDCNLRCRYCFAGTGDFGTGRRSMLSEETGKAAIDFLIRESGPRHHLDIDFFGGEPLMNWPLVKELVRYCEDEGPKRGKDIRLTVTTNAVLLDDGKIDFINEHFKNVVLSIDGRKEIHDRMRPDAGGHGSWERAVRNIRKLVAKRGKKDYFLRGTYTAFNKDFSKDVLALAEIAPQLSIEPVVCAPDLPWALHQEDLPQLKEEYEKLAAAMLGKRKNGEAIHFFHFIIDGDHSPCLFKRLKGCGVGTEYCAVTPDGDIYPCHQLVGEEEFILGNVLRGGLDRSAETAARQEAFRRLLTQNDCPPCSECWARYYCGGGCAANGWHSTASLQGKDEFSCELLRKRIECALWLQSKSSELS